MTTTQQLTNALKVMILTPHIRQYLLANDPKAFEQARQAIAAAEPVTRASTPHVFQPTEPGSDTCGVCGKIQFWTVHQGGQVAMQFAHEMLEATHATIVARKDAQSWVLFTGPKPEAAKALTAIGDTLNLIGANAVTAPFEFKLYYHPEVK
jgi:hypothetical protein